MQCNVCQYLSHKDIYHNNTSVVLNMRWCDFRDTHTSAQAFLKRSVQAILTNFTIVLCLKILLYTNFQEIPCLYYYCLWCSLLCNYEIILNNQSKHAHLTDWINIDNTVVVESVLKQSQDYILVNYYNILFFKSRLVYNTCMQNGHEH